MVDRNLFRTASAVADRSVSVPATDTVNEAGGSAYSLSAEAALAQYACTGCLGQTYYASAQTELAKVLELARAVSPEFLAKTAVYARERGYMKDMPALLLAVLMTRSDPKDGLLEDVFSRVIDNGKMLGNFVQIVRSGQVGRKSFGSRTRDLIRYDFLRQDPARLFRMTVGMSPPIEDVVKMVHPDPASRQHSALFAYWIGKLDPEKAIWLPEVVQDFERWKLDRVGSPPDVDFRLLTALNLSEADWRSLAMNANWTSTRMNLNTFLRHGVFNQVEMVEVIAQRLRDPELIARAKAFPYQLLMAYEAAKDGLPSKITDALQDALDVSLSNIPVIDGKVFVFPDISGSMSSPVTGNRGRGSTTNVSCNMVASLIAAAFLRRMDDVEVVPFHTQVVPVKLNRRDSAASIAKAIFKLPGGGTSVSAPMAWLNASGRQGDLIVYASDNESWVDSSPTASDRYYGRREQSGTALMREWKQFKARNPRAKMVCIDLTPNAHTQASDDKSILNVGGFSDSVFDVVSLFAQGGLTPEHWVGEINKVALR